MPDNERSVDAVAAYDLVRGFAVKFEKGMGDENALEIRVDFDALWNLAQSFVDDVYRYKAYHETPVPDRVRRAAYLCKWLIKLRPIVVVDPQGGNEEVRTFSLMANETFALFCVSGVMKFDWDSVSDKIRTIFLYSLRHRYNSEDTYILFFAQLCNL